MFARHVAVKLRPGTLAEFIRVMDDEVLPWLRKQKGFLDTITLAVPVPCPGFGTGVERGRSRSSCASGSS